MGSLQSELLRMLQEKDVADVVLDMAAVEVIDSQGFAALRKLIGAIELSGGAAVVAAMRPGVAATLVDLDVDLSGIRAIRTVQ